MITFISFRAHNILDSLRDRNDTRIIYLIAQYPSGLVKFMVTNWLQPIADDIIIFLLHHYDKRRKMLSIL